MNNPLELIMLTAAKAAEEPADHIAGEVGKAAVAVTPDATEEGTYFIARTLMSLSQWLLDLVGLGKHTQLFTWVYIIIVFLFAMAIGMLIKWFTVYVLDKLKPHIRSNIYASLVDRHFFLKICRFIPAVIFLILIQFTLYMHSSISLFLTRATSIYIVIIVAMAMCSLCDVIWDTLDQRENKQKLPLRGLAQVAKLIIWIIAVIITAAILLNKSPGTLLAGLGAFAAVLMLIFKDSILGIVAGVQLAQNESLHVGDWISLPDGQANGVVDEVTLTDVKIINWDKTVSTVPPYTLISNGFKNYRNMQQSQTRRIQRSYMIDADSVVETTPEMLEKFKGLPLMKEWITKKIEQRDAGKTQNVNNSAGLADGSIETNLGVFRAYFKMYLDSNPDISHSDDCFVTTLAQTAAGIPLQVYCFTNTSKWFPYEGIQATVFEHLAAMLHKFNLYTFENPSGRDTIIDGYMSPGKVPAPLFGLPYPFFLNSGTPSQPGLTPGEASATDRPATSGSNETANPSVD